MPGTHHKYSPSKLDRIRACPGSVRAVADLPEVDMDNHETNAAAEEGIMLHSVMAGEITDDALTPDQHNVIDELRAYDYLHFGDAPDTFREQKVSLISDDFSVITEGTADLIALYPDMAKAEDYKTGRKWVNPDSLQCKAYGAAIMQTHGVDTVEFHVSQPRAGHGKPILFTDFEALRAEVAAVIAAADDPCAPLCPGDHCRYCPARLTCTATANQAAALMERPAFDLDNPATLGRAARVAQLVKKRCDEVLARCKEETVDGQATGFHIAERSGRKRVTNPQAAYERLQEFIALPDFLGILDVPISKLTEAVVPCIKESMGKTTKEAEALLWERLGDVVTAGEPTKIMIADKE